MGETLEPLDLEVDHIELLHDCDPEELENRFKQFRELKKIRKEIQFLEDYETVATAIKAPWLRFWNKIKELIK